MGMTPDSPPGSCRGPYTLAIRRIECRVPCSRLYRPMYCSAQYLAMPVGDSGSGSTSSRDGMGAFRPYSAPPEEANSTRASMARAASSTLTVPTTLACASVAGLDTDERTAMCAARWQISRGRTWRTRPVNESASAMLSLCRVAASSSRPARPADRSSTTVTSSPRARNPSVRWEPMNPAPPVTSTRMLVDPRCCLITVSSPEVYDQPRCGQGKLPAEGGGRLGPAALAVVPGHQVGQHQVPGPGLGRVLRGLPGGQVHIPGQARPGQERGLAEHQVGAAGQPGERGRRAGVRRVGNRPAAGLDPEAERLDRVVHVRERDPERPDLPGPGVQRAEVEGPRHAHVLVQAVGLGHPVRGAGRAVHRDARAGPVRRVRLRHPVPAQVKTVIRVQVAQADGIDAGQRGVPLQRAEGAVAEIDEQPEALVLEQIGRSRAVRAGEGTRTPDDSE